jgi:hypothetical protein
MLKKLIDYGTSFFTGGAGITSYLAIALALSLAFGGWQLSRVSDRDETIGAQGEVINRKNGEIAGLTGQLHDERDGRERDRAIMAINLRNYHETIQQTELLDDERRRFQRRIKDAKPLPPDIEALCRPVLYRLNGLAPWLRDRLGLATPAGAGADGRGGAGADPGLSGAGAGTRGLSAPR